jgi:hypothetical protein
MSVIGADELIFTNDTSNGIYSGGFSVNSIMMKKGISPIVTLNDPLQNIQGGENVGDLFDNIVIPNWAYYLPSKMIGGTSYKSKQNDSDSDEDDVIDNDLHDKLLELVKPDMKEMRKSKTSRKNIIKTMKKKTRKHLTHKK